MVGWGVPRRRRERQQRRGGKKTPKKTRKKNQTAKNNLPTRLAICEAIPSSRTLACASELNARMAAGEAPPEASRPSSAADSSRRRAILACKRRRLFASEKECRRCLQAGQEGGVVAGTQAGAALPRERYGPNSSACGVRPQPQAGLGRRASRHQLLWRCHGAPKPRMSSSGCWPPARRPLRSRLLNTLCLQGARKQ